VWHNVGHFKRLAMLEEDGAGADDREHHRLGKVLERV
jgi:hypothetical protein